MFNEGDNKARDHNHVTGKYRGSAHWDCNINLNPNKAGLFEGSFFWTGVTPPSYFIKNLEELISI